MHKNVHLSAPLFHFPACRRRSALILFLIAFLFNQFGFSLFRTVCIEAFQLSSSGSNYYSYFANRKQKYRKCIHPDKITGDWFQEINRHLLIWSLTFYLKVNFSDDSWLSKLIEHIFKALWIIPAFELAVSVSIFYLGKVHTFKYHCPYSLVTSPP